MSNDKTPLTAVTAADAVAATPAGEVAREAIAAAPAAPAKFNKRSLLRKIAYGAGGAVVIVGAVAGAMFLLKSKAAVGGDAEAPVASDATVSA